MDKTISVDTTTNYEMFKLLDWNREIDEKRVYKISEKITQYGFLLPILVNQNYYVIDGQHRLSAAKLSKSEVKYIIYEIEDEFLPYLVTDVNTTSHSWSVKQHYNMWLRLGKEEYIKIENLLNDVGFTFKEFQIVSSGGNLSKLIKAGIFILSEQREKRVKDAYKVMDDIFCIDEKLSGYRNDNSFRFAIIRIFTSAKYSHKRMMKMLPDNTAHIGKSKNIGGYIDSILAVYNVGLQEERRIRTGR